jgi:hypothetical protein
LRPFNSAMLSVLKKAGSCDIVEEPFPHLVIRGALDDEVYRRLEETFPSSEILTQGRRLAGKERYGYSARDVIGNPRIHPLWQSFFSYHASRDFLKEVVGLFWPWIRKAHPNLEGRFGRELSELRSNVRFREPMTDIAMDVQFIYNSASDSPTPIIGPHLDRPVALYAGLFYLRQPGDHSTGGDLELWRFKKGKRVFEPGKRTVSQQYVELAETIAYEANTFVLFPHSIDALHAVSIRSPSRHPRLHVNLIAEFAEPIYTLADYEIAVPEVPEQVHPSHELSGYGPERT